MYGTSVLCRFGKLTRTGLCCILYVDLFVRLLLTLRNTRFKLSGWRCLCGYEADEDHKNIKP